MPLTPSLQAILPTLGCQWSSIETALLSILLMKLVCLSGLGYGLDNVTPRGIDFNASSTADSTVTRTGSASSVGRQRVPVSVRSNGAGTDNGQTFKKPGLQALPEARLSTHTQAPASGTAPTRADSTTKPNASAVDSGTRPSTGSAPRRDPHPFLTTENAHAHAKDPRFEGHFITFWDDDFQIQRLPPGVFLSPRKRGISLQEEHMDATKLPSCCETEPAYSPERWPSVSSAPMSRSI